MCGIRNGLGGPVYVPLKQAQPMMYPIIGTAGVLRCPDGASTGAGTRTKTTTTTPTATPTPTASTLPPTTLVLITDGGR